MTNSVTVVIGGVTYTGTLTSAAAPPAQVGLKVVGTKLVQPNGMEFRIRGVNQCHYDNSNAVAGLNNTKANAVRLFITQQYGATPAQLAAVCAQHIAGGRVAIPVLSSINTAGTTWAGTTGDQNPTDFGIAVAWWVANAGLFAPILNDGGILNIANEWGPSDSLVWSKAAITALPQLRAAGYTCPVLIDTGGSGQDEMDIELYAKSIVAVDPNVLFGYHVYGGTTDYQCAIASVSGATITLNSTSATHPFAPTFNGTNNSYSGITQMVVNGLTIPVKQNVGGVPGAWTVTATAPVPAAAALAGAMLYDWGNIAVRVPRLASYGVCVAIMEFGPGNNVGPSPTLVTPQQVINACETAGIGWCPWAWDDNNAANELSVQPWFNMTVVAGLYKAPSDLTAYGQAMVAEWAALA